MQVTYCVRWNFEYGGPIDPLTEEQARRRDVSGELYSVALGDPAGLYAVIEVMWQNKHLGVWFFDEQGRQGLKYSFNRVSDATLFLKSITRWQHPDNDAWGLNESELIEKITYRQDGVVRHDVRDKKAQEQRIVDRHSVNLDINWEPVPAFGDWESVSRWDRELPGQPVPDRATERPAP